MGAEEVVASRLGERVADACAIACLPILTDKESAEAPSLFASSSSHHSDTVSSRSLTVPGFPETPAIRFRRSRSRTGDQTDSRRLRLTATACPSSTPPMDAPEETRELPDVTIRAQETSPGFFVASYHPTSPATHPARHGFGIDTKRGLRGKNLAKILDFAEA